MKSTEELKQEASGKLSGPAMAHGVRSDLLLRLQQPVFVISMFGALATGALAAIASFRISLPDGSRLWMLLPLPTSSLATPTKICI